jgi:hypothetical protein
MGSLLVFIKAGRNEGLAVTPAKAGGQSRVPRDWRDWIPAFAGMTVRIITSWQKHLSSRPAFRKNHFFDRAFVFRVSARPMASGNVSPQLLRTLAYESFWFLPGGELPAPSFPMPPRLRADRRSPCCNLRTLLYTKRTEDAAPLV